MMNYKETKMTKEKLYIKPTEEEYEEVKDLNNTNKKILTYSILAIIMILATIGQL